MSLLTKLTEEKDVRTPVARITYPSGSPETSYFGNPENRYRRVSRWRDDWEQLEVLVRHVALLVFRYANR